MNNMIKVIVTAMVFMAISAFSVAQDGKFGASPEDSLECVKNLSLYKNPYFDNKQYKEAVKYWRIAVAICPGSRKSLYINGVKMYEKFIEKEQNETKKEKLIDTLFWIYDKRIEHFGEEGYVLGRKGADMLKYRKDDPKGAYDALKRSFELQGNEMEAGAIITFYQSLYILYRKKQAEKIELLELYPKLSDVCSHNAEREKNPKIADGFRVVQQNLDKMFAQVAGCADIVEVFSPKFDANPKDTTFLIMLTRLLKNRDCAEEALFYNAAINLNELKPSAASNYNLGLISVKKDKCSTAVEYFNSAAEMTGEGETELKTDAYIKAAKCCIKLGQYSNARMYAQKALGANPNLGEAYLVIATAYAASAKECGDNDCNQKSAYWAAVDKLQKAKAIDKSVTKEANEQIAKYSNYFPNQEKCFFYGITEGTEFKVECWINEVTTVRFSK